MRFGDKAINETEAKEIMNELTDNVSELNEGLVNLLQLNCSVLNYVKYIQEA